MYNKINSCEHIIVSQDEAEMIKYFKNCFLATKVSFCNEMYEFCKKSNINYNIVANFVKLDERIGKTHLNVPGPDRMFGFGGTCFPKDIHALEYEFKNKGVDCHIISAAIKRNETIDRKDKDWLLDKGRATI
jgi:UDPglucose 6-dehydrogenase